MCARQRRAVRPAPDLQAAPVFAALGDGTRLQIVARLSGGGPQSITGLSDGAGVTRQAVTKHLHVLADAGLVRSERRGRETVWSLETRRLEIAHRFLNAISTRWDEALDRLKDLVEG